jgi:surfeit locus 1 family protein
MLVLPPMLAAYLGVWQVGRREEKIHMLEERERMMSSDELSLDEDPKAFSDDVPSLAQDSLPEYRKVRLSGSFNDDRSVFVGPRPRSSMGITEAGYFMVTPMMLDNDARTTVLVLRGWVPESWKKDPSKREIQDGPSRPRVLSIRGVVRRSERPSMFVPENQPQRGDWYYIDVPAMAKSLDLPESTPLIELVTFDDDALMQYGGKSKATAMDILGGRTTVRQIHEEKGGEKYPIRKSLGDLQHFSVMPRDHLNYAITWFTLSAATSGIAYAILRKKGIR